MRIITESQNMFPDNVSCGEQSDGSIVDRYGNVMTRERRDRIIETINDLPATAMRQNIVDAVVNNQITIIDGETGSWKTTQVPKIVHAEMPNQQIIALQPRVFAAMSNTRRISEELLAQTGNPDYSVGYRIGYRTGRGVSSKKASQISLHTDALELMRQGVSKIYPNVLILDEIHHFSIPTTILAMMLKHRRDIRLIIMSATIDPTVFQEYFSHVSTDIPVVKIPGRTYPIDRKYKMAEDAIPAVCEAYKQGKNVLFFVPGKKEIDAHIELLRKNLGAKTPIYELHSELPKEEQEFLLTNKTGKPRIIVSTNVAEESITIDYLDYVVDLATAKIARYNKFGIEELRLENVSQANCRQRSGRGGRTHNGEYFYANDVPYNELHEYPEPPIHREMIDRYILVLAAGGMDIVAMNDKEKSQGKSLFFHKLNEGLLKISLQRLRRIGAIDSRRNITGLGKDLLKIPLDVYQARMIYEGIKRKCLGDMIYVASILEHRGFVSKDGAWKKMDIPGGDESDLLWFASFFKILVSRKLSDKYIQMLLELGISSEQMALFIAHDGNYKLYEVVDLSVIGIKLQRLRNIDDTITDLLERMESSGLEITYSDNLDDKKICMATGSLHNIYEYSKSKSLFRNSSQKWGKDCLYFEAWDITLVKPSDAKNLYLGLPFIIGDDSEKREDLNLVTFLTSVEKKHISAAEKSTLELQTQKTDRSLGVVRDRELESVNPRNKDVSRWVSQQPKDAFIWKNSTGGSIGAPESEAAGPGVATGVKDEEDQEILPASWYSIGQAEMDYAFALDDYNAAMGTHVFETEEDSRTYWIINCLPDFLISRNQKIRKYIVSRDKDGEDLYIFRELLKRFILENQHTYLNPKKSILQLQRNLVYNTDIIDDFVESNDPYIRTFVRWGKLDSVPVAQITREIIPVFSGDPENFIRQPEETEEVKTMRNAYIQLTKRIPSKHLEIDMQALAEIIFTAYLRNAKAFSEELMSVCVAHATLGEAHHSEIQNILWSIKDVEWAHRERKKNQIRYSRLEQLHNALARIIAGKTVRDRSVFEEKTLLKTQRESVVERLVRALELAESSDIRRKNRGIRLLESSFVGNMESQMARIKKEIVSLTRIVELVHAPLAKQIRDGLTKLLQDFFEPECFQKMLSHKMTDFTRRIIRDPIAQNIGVEKIILQLIRKKHFFRSKDFTGLFQEIQEYDDIRSTLEAYQWAVLHEIRTSTDIEYIRKRTMELQDYIARYSRSKEAISPKITSIRQSAADMAIVGNHEYWAHYL